MASLLDHLRKRKLVQWAIAYLAGTWVVFEVTDAVGGRLGGPDVLYRGLLVVLGIGFLVTLVIAWYHGEMGYQRVRRTELLIVAALLVLAGGVLTSLPGGPKEPEPPDGPAGSYERTAIAVLPLRNLNADGPHGYFAGGLHEELLTQLAKVATLRPISRTSVMEYEETDMQIGKIAQELRVGSVLEGSVQVLGERLRVHGRRGGVRRGRGRELWRVADGVFTHVADFETPMHLTLTRS
jgi:serine/threonine-protein kinase